MVDGSLDAQDYNEIKTRYENEIAKLKRELSVYNSVNSKMKEYINYAIDVLQNIDKLFADTDLDTKQAIMCSIYSEKIIFDKNECRTPKFHALPANFSMVIFFVLLFFVCIAILFFCL
jgi:hypothetical protein